MLKKLYLKSILDLTIPAKVNLGCELMPTQTPTRLPNDTYRSREHLTPDEVRRLIDAAGSAGRHCERDRTLVLLMFRHGLRAGEAFGLRWDAISLEARTVTIKRLKQRARTPQQSTHRLQSDEAEALHQVRDRYPESYYVFPTETGGQLSHASIARIVTRAGELAEIPLPVHPHMLRHSCGYFLAEQGLPTRDIQEYLGHKSIASTVKYTAGNPARFDRIQWGGRDE